ncbi:MAG: N-acetyl-alpha-D-glucosaminyl L-malate synthase BshA [Thermaerobacter sp.]|nr:N-acetyl-alpha-D-glucosaminyl L-malate synthase BshA [Thermaerobacter sp.]
MRIGMVGYPSYGGSGVVATELGCQLARRGHQVHFISYDYPFRLDDCRENVAYHEVSVPSYYLFKYPPYLLSLASKLLEVASYEHLDVLHVHYALPHAVSAFLAKQMHPGPLAVVTTLHGTDITLAGREPSLAPLVVLAIRESDAVTAVSHYLVQATREHFPVERPIEWVPNFVDGDKYRPRGDLQLRARLGEPGERLLLHVSNFRPVKRLEAVVEIFARVQVRLPSRLLLVGDGPDCPRARERAAALGVADRVHFLGSQERVEELMAAADLFLLPSREESFGLAALEAMACGLPVVASRVGGLPEVVVEGTGYLGDPQDLEGMARAAVEILQDEDQRREMGAAARRAALERYAAELVVPRYEAIYARLAGKGVA